MQDWCPYNTRLLPLQCKTAAPAMQDCCPCNARLLPLQCKTAAPAMQDCCPCNARLLPLQCKTAAPTMQDCCPYNARLLPLQYKRGLHHCCPSLCCFLIPTSVVSRMLDYLVSQCVPSHPTNHEIITCGSTSCKQHLVVSG